jgi:hypothetical protein
MVDARPFDPALFADAAIDAELDQQAGDDRTRQVAARNCFHSVGARAGLPICEGLGKDSRRD